MLHRNDTENANTEIDVTTVKLLWRSRRHAQLAPTYTAVTPAGHRGHSLQTDGAMFTHCKEHQPTYQALQLGRRPRPHAVPEQSGAGTPRAQQKHLTDPAYRHFCTSIKVCFTEYLALTTSAAFSWLIQLYFRAIMEQFVYQITAYIEFFCRPVHFVITRAYCIVQCLLSRFPTLTSSKNDPWIEQREASRRFGGISHV